MQIYGAQMTTLTKILKGIIKLHNARIERRSKSLLKNMPNTVQSFTIDNKMQHIHWKRRNEHTQNKWILLFPTKEKWINLKRGAISSSHVRRGTQQRAINKFKNTLSKKIQFHLHSPIKIIGVCELQGDNLLSVGERNNCCYERIYGSRSNDDNMGRRVTDQSKGGEWRLHCWLRRKQRRVCSSCSSVNGVHWKERRESFNVFRALILS